MKDAFLEDPLEDFFEDPLQDFLEDPLKDFLEDDLDIAAALALLDGWHDDFLEGDPYLRSSQSVSSSQNEDGELLWGEKG